MAMRSSLPAEFAGRDQGQEARAEHSPEWQAAFAEYRAAREQMVAVQLIERGVTDPNVLDAVFRVPRHRFVPDAEREWAYADRPLALAGDQTISQPYIVASMTQAAGLSPHDRVLEIGTGSGYQTAVLSELCREVYSVEFLPEVAALGRENLAALGYLERGVELRVADGYEGWPERAPFDAILVTAAPPRVPEPLLDQLAVGGRMVIPVGVGKRQHLECWQRLEPGNEASAFLRRRLYGVRFVPFLGPRVSRRTPDGAG
jgi:protein-L-isoaspartate(D-aspartate) O-methyltransferase